jgi:hypothetical protein
MRTPPHACCSGQGSCTIPTSLSMCPTTTSSPHRRPKIHRRSYAPHDVRHAICGTRRRVTYSSHVGHSPMPLANAMALHEGIGLGEPQDQTKDEAEETIDERAI